MALAAYDADEHHIGLGDAVGTKKGFLIHGFHQEILQQLPRVVDFGSADPLVSAPSLARWTMDDFLGGAYWSTWRTDDPAIFSGSQNFISSQLGRSLTTVPPLVIWDDETGGTTPGAFLGTFAYGEHIYTVWEKKVVRTKVTDKARSEVATTSGDWDCFGLDFKQFGALYVWLYNGAGNAFQRWEVSTAGVWISKTTYPRPAAATGDCLGMSFDGPLPIFQFNKNMMFTAALSDLDSTQPTWTDVGRVSAGVWKGSVVHNGLVYILAVDINFRTSIWTYDGTAVSLLVEFPFNFEGRCISAFAGRVYVGGTGKDFAGVATYAEFYEITGASLRLIKTFAPEDRIASATDVPFALKSLAYYEGLLFLGASGDHLVAYDVVNDALFGACQIPGGAPFLATENLLVSRNQLFVFMSSATAGLTGWYRVGQTEDSTRYDYSGELITAEFQPEPGLNKRWSELHLLSRFGVLSANAPTVDFSTDGGTSWVAATVTQVVTGTMRRTVADLSTAPISRQIRFRLRFPRVQDVATFTELLSFTMTFAFLDTGKRSWSFGILGPERMEDAEGRSYIQDVSEVHDQLWTWAQGGSQLFFTDLDGESYKVTIRSMTQTTDPAQDRADGQLREGVFSVSLVEV